MTDASPTPAASNRPQSAWTEDRSQVRSWLDRAAPQLADVYAGAVTVALDPGFPGRVVFVWHAIREIRNRLPDALAGEEKSTSVQYGQLADEVTRCWRADGWPGDGSVDLGGPTEPPDTGPQRPEISGELLQAVGRLVEAHGSIEGRNLRNARRLFQAAGGSEVPDYVLRAWNQEGRRAHKLAHVNNKPTAPEDVAALEEDFDRFESWLRAFANRSYENMDELDELLQSANG